MTGQETIESSLFSQAVFAVKFLQTAVANDPQHQVAAEMTSAIDALRDVVEAQKRHNDAYEGSNPFEKPLPPSLSTRDLPLPPLEKVMTCLRMAQGLYRGLTCPSVLSLGINPADFIREHPRVHMQRALEFKSPGHFTEYVVKAYSPGSITDAELIIVHMGLYWFFSKCSSTLKDATVQHEYDAQARVCRDNLEIVLSNLSFHTPTTLDYVHAMYLATLYCLQKSKPVAGWAFISKASLLAQALGLQINNFTTTGSFDENQRNVSLFWALYRLEKAISLRLGRSSTMRDHDITVLWPNAERETLPWYWRIPNIIETASLYGRLFDNIYSPRALSQPVAIRAAHARELSAELKRIMTTSSEFFEQHAQETSHPALEPKLLDFFKHADRASSYSLLTSIYKSIPAGQSSSCPECLSAARTNLQEHVICMTMVADEALQCPLIDFWVNGGLLFSPFIPFNIIFCNIVETSEASDLQHLLQVADILESTSQIPRYSAACAKQLRIFKALHDVARKYVEIKSKTRQDPIIGGDINGLDIETYLSTSVAGPDYFASSTFAIPTPASVGVREQAEGNSEQGLMHLNDQIPGGFGMEGVLSGAELGDWFYRSHQMMRFLDGSSR
ncbi:hypothetical protein QQX98_005198 [Neonectria punicea]|uniref:Xylanolytic transcriptional activator regulatory domain-containing protein n=1 Tax=Neonectria punicea TaxID=979145 RepID=A0ABR1H6E2_9HYPO